MFGVLCDFQITYCPKLHFFSEFELNVVQWRFRALDMSLQPFPERCINFYYITLVTVSNIYIGQGWACMIIYHFKFQIQCAAIRLEM